MENNVYNASSSSSQGDIPKERNQTSTNEVANTTILESIPIGSISFHCHLVRLLLSEQNILPKENRIYLFLSTLCGMRPIEVLQKMDIDRDKYKKSKQKI